MTVSKEIEEIIIKSVSEIFENMAFLEIWPRNKKLWEGNENEGFRQALISVQGNEQGQIKMVIAPGLLREATCNIYGISHEEILPEMERDTLAELLNTVAGNVMEKITPKEICYELGIPHIQMFQEENIKMNQVTCLFGVGGEFLQVAYLFSD